MDGPGPGCEGPDGAGAGPSIALGATELTLVSDGEPLWLSGEALYGCPALSGWAGHTPPDGAGNIAVALRVLLVRSPHVTALVDTGVHRDEIPGRASGLPGGLAALGVRPGDVEIVVLTHAHLDHIGHNTRRVGDGWVPSFPEARYVIQETEAEALRASDPARWERYWFAAWSQSG